MKIKRRSWRLLDYEIFFMVPGAGVEPAHPYEREILRAPAPL